MKLLELTRSYYPAVGGLERFVSDKTRMYDRLGIDWKLISTNKVSQKVDHALEDDSVLRLAQFTSYNITPALHRHLRGGYDIVNINLLGRFYSDYAIQYFSRTRTKIILTPCFSFHSEGRYAVKKLFEHFVFPYLLKKVDAMVVFTHVERSWWIDRYQVPPGKIFVIPPYLDGVNGPQQTIVFSQPFLLYLGRAGANKKTDLLLDAFLRLNIADLDLVLTIEPQDVAAPLREEVLKNPRVKLVGYVDDRRKSELLSGCEAVIFPTEYESFGYVAFEAAKHAKPLLCSDIPVFRELLDGRGTLFFSNDQGQLSETLVRFISMSTTEKRRMGETNRHVAEKFDIESTTERYRSLFASLLSGPATTEVQHHIERSGQ